MFEARQRVIYGDTDQMGVVYYANYFRYFEMVRGELLRAKGASYAALEKEGFQLPVVEATCRYQASARYEDLLLVRTALCDVRRVSLAFRYEIVREGDGKLLCTGKTVHACLAPNGRPTKLPASLMERLADVTEARVPSGPRTDF